jgi:type IV pilus assembly protein PilM
MPVTSTAFSRFFPVPRMIAMPACGLSVVDQSLHAVELERTRRGARLHRFAALELPASTLSSGAIVDQNAFVEALKKFSAQNRLSLVHAVIPEDSSYLFEVPLQGGEIANLDLVASKLEENVPLPPKEVIFDFEEATESGRKVALVSAAPKSAVQNYLEAFGRAGLLTLSLETESSALSRTLAASDAPTAIVSIGLTRTILVVGMSKLPRYSSVIDIGTSSFIEAAQKYFNLSDVEAAKRIAISGFSDTAVAEALIGTLSALRKELDGRLRFFQGQSGQRASSIALVGRGASLPRLTDYLAQSMRLPVALGNVWQGALLTGQVPPKLSLNEALRYATAISGATLSLG